MKKNTVSLMGHHASPHHTKNMGTQETDYPERKDRMKFYTVSFLAGVWPRSPLFRPFNLRMQRATGQMARPDQFGKVRKDIARVKTVLQEIEAKRPEGEAR